MHFVHWHAQLILSDVLKAHQAQPRSKAITDRRALIHNLCALPAPWVLVRTHISGIEMSIVADMRSECVIYVVLRSAEVRMS